MAKFVINKRYDDKKEVEAAKFFEKGSFVIFSSAASEQVYAVPTGKVHSIELVKDAQ